MKLSIIIYKTKYGTEFVSTWKMPQDQIDIADNLAAHYKACTSGGEVVISQQVCVDLDIPMLTEDEIRLGEIRAIKQLISKKKEEALAEIEPLEVKLQELLAITQEMK